jgi:hypothetical protein
LTGELAFSYVRFDGRKLDPGPKGPGRRLRVDPRCLAGDPVAGAVAHVCALADPDATLRFDEPEVQGARRDALAWWIGLLADDFVCLSTFALDASRCAGAVTVARSSSRFGDDPFLRLFGGTVVETDAFSPVPPPPGPVIERYAGAPWPGGSFQADAG